MNKEQVDRTSISLPVDLAEYARAKGKGNTSAYLASLIERDRRLDRIKAMLAEHGYTGDRAVTDVGVAAMRERLNQVRRQRANGRQQAA
ncbi:hypothetical protein [Catellatospora sp. IY07-71]|uniref:hypothetical protein n=1 Tax=Catellatospora sp. IY07-71 TaxID=2728827 RepID=UPI001BB42088|nr:hypothetical protein [Catellatospora sp. IY07-71]